VEETWEKAIGVVSEKLSSYKGDEIAVICCSETTNEDNYILQKLARAVLGTNNIDHAGRLGYIPSPGRGESPKFIDRIADAQCIFAIGTDPTSSQPVIGVEVKRAQENGAKIIIAGTYRSGLCRIADAWLQNRPGTELILLGGIMKVIIDEKLAGKNAGGYDSLKKVLAGLDMDKVEEVTGVPVEQIKEAARIYTGAESAMTLYGEGVTQQSAGNRIVSALMNLALLTGNTESGVNPVIGMNNVQGACDMGVMPGYSPGYKPLKKHGMSFDEMLAALDEGKIKATYIIGDDPRLRGKLDKVEFVVAQNMFPSAVINDADVVLPSASLAEKDGTFTNTERRVQAVKKAVEPYENSKPDWWITCRIAQKMGGEGFSFRSAKGITAEIKKALSALEADKNPGFTELTYNIPAAVTDKKYPLIISAVPGLYYFNAAAMDAGLGEFSILESEPRVTVSAEDAAGMGLSEGDGVKLVSKWGEVTAKVKVENNLPAGVLNLPAHFAYGLLNPAADPETGLPEYRACAVRLEKE
jgi:predicted molibdopterin-dependent oxidoreductase YjgC